MEAHNCRSDRRETGTQIGQRGKTENRIGYQIRKPVNIFRENRKPNAKKRKMNTKTKETKFFGTKTEKPFQKKAKTENSNAPLFYA